MMASAGITCNIKAILSFYVTNGNENRLVHKEKSLIAVSSKTHSSIGVFKKYVLNYTGASEIARQKGLGENVDVSLARTFKGRESFSIRTQQQWNNEMPQFFKDEESNLLQGKYNNTTCDYSDYEISYQHCRMVE